MWYAVPGGIAVGAVRIYQLQHLAVFVLLLVTSAAFCVFGFPFLLTVFAIASVPAILQFPIPIVFCDIWIISTLFIIFSLSFEQWEYQWKRVEYIVGKVE